MTAFLQWFGDLQAYIWLIASLAKHFLGRGWLFMVVLAISWLTVVLLAMAMMGMGCRYRAFRSLVNLDALGRNMFAAHDAGVSLLRRSMSGYPRVGLQLFSPRLARAIRLQVLGPNPFQDDLDEGKLSPAAVAVSR